MVRLDQKSSLSPPPIELPPSPLPFSVLQVSPSSSSVNWSPLHFLSHTAPLPRPLRLLLLPPLVQPPGPAFGPLEARWPLCSWRHGVWRVRTPARGKGLMTSCWLVEPQGRYIMARNNLKECRPLWVTPFWTGSHLYGERKELLLSLATYLLLDVLADRTAGRHMYCTRGLG